MLCERKDGVHVRIQLGVGLVFEICIMLPWPQCEIATAQHVLVAAR